MGEVERDRDDAVMGFVLLGLLGAGATNAVVAVLDAVVWAWVVAGACLLPALLCGLAWREPDGPRAGRVDRGGGNRARQGEPAEAGGRFRTGTPGAGR